MEQQRRFAPEKGVAFCGLACCVCGENTHCPGCRAGGCPGGAECPLSACCRGRGLAGCWDCPDFPYAQPMLQKPRVRAFCRLAARYGADALTRRLGENEARGLRYHHPGRLTGDYDAPGDEEAVMALVFPAGEEGPHGLDPGGLPL